MSLSSPGPSIGVTIVLVLPLIFFPQSFNPYEFPKFIVFSIGVQICAFLYFLSRLQGKNRGVNEAPRPASRDVVSSPLFGGAKSAEAEGKRIHPRAKNVPWSSAKADKRSWLTLMVIVFGVIVFLSNIFGIDIKQSLIGSPFRHQGFLMLFSCMLLFFILQSLHDEEKRKLFVIFQKGVFISAFAVCAVALYQAVAYFTFHDTAIATFQGRIVGTMGNPNFLGGFLAMTLPFVLWKKDNTQLKVVLLILIVVAVFLTQSRSAYVAISVVFAGFLFGFLNPIHRLRLALACVGIIVFTTIFVLSTMTQSITNRVAFKADDQSKYCLYSLPENVIGNSVLAVFDRYPVLLGRISFCEDRFSIWRAGIESVLQKPILGIGQENFAYIYPRQRGLYVDSAHNIFLEIAVASGFAGLVLFVTIIIIAFRTSALPVKFSLFAFLISASFNPLSIAQIALFWMLLGFAKR